MDDNFALRAVLWAGFPFLRLESTREFAFQRLWHGCFCR